MPIYDYGCSACGRRTDILHGINDPIPTFCPECGAEGTLRKGFAPPAIVFKGSGWAKKDRSSAARTKASNDRSSDSKASSDGAGSGGTSSEPSTASSGSTPSGSAPTTSGPSND